MTDPAQSIGLVLHNACGVGLFWSSRKMVSFQISAKGLRT
jgi:hypothetical protein